MARPLSPKQQAFVREYLIDLVASQAYIRAGYAARGNAAETAAARLLRNVQVQAAIAEGMAARQARVKIDQDRVLLEIARLAFSDPRKAFDRTGNLLPIQEWPDEVAAAVASIEVDEIADKDGNVLGHTKKIKFWDKSKNLDLAARHLGMLNDKLKVNLTVDPVQEALDQCQGTAYRPPGENKT
jgi:phage terminase small subunit